MSPPRSAAGLLKERCPECHERELGVKRRRVNEDGDTISTTYVCGNCGYEEEREGED